MSEAAHTNGSPTVVLVHGAYADGSSNGVIERLQAKGMKVTAPVGTDFDGAGANGHAYAQRFSGPYSHRVLDGIGHNVPQEAPEAFAGAILDIGGAK